MTYNVFVSGRIQQLLLIVLVLSISGCVSSSRHLQRGNYDQAIDRAMKKLSRKPDNQDEQEVLKKAYKLAMDEDRQRIRELRRTGQPNVYAEIFRIYEQMEARQNKVRRLPSKVLNRIEYQYVNFEQEKSEAQRKAAEFFYVNGKRLLDTGDRFDARKAHNEFVQAGQILPGYKDIERLKQQAIAWGTTQVLFTMSNQSGTPLPKGFEKELFQISLSSLNRQWLNFDTRRVERKAYHYNVNLMLQGIMVSPERVQENEYVESRVVDDGWEYVLDANGNVKKDSLGNDIKVKKTKEISCRVKETTLLKHTTVTGRLEFVENQTGQVIKTDPVTAEWYFEHAFVQAFGDIEALSDETRSKLGVKPAPFPPSEVMILNSAQVLKDMSMDIIRRNRRLFQ